MSVPWWVLLILAIFAAVTVGCAREDLGAGTSRWLIALDVAGSVLLAMLALAFWIDPVAEFIGSAALVLLAGAAATTIMGVVRDVSSVAASRVEKLMAVGLLALIEGPLYYWAVLFAAIGARKV